MPKHRVNARRLTISLRWVKAGWGGHPETTPCKAARLGCCVVHRTNRRLPQPVLLAWAVPMRSEGKNIFYSVADPGLLEILSVLYRLHRPKEMK